MDSAQRILNSSAFAHHDLVQGLASGPALAQLLTGLLTFSLTLWTILGNSFVLFAISTNKVLLASGTSNWLIGNLAVSDLLLGGTVLPFSAAFTTFKKWLFGRLICHLWLSIDVIPAPIPRPITDHASPLPIPF